MSAKVIPKKSNEKTSQINHSNGIKLHGHPPKSTKPKNKLKHTFNGQRTDPAFLVCLLKVVAQVQTTVFVAEKNPERKTALGGTQTSD